MRKLITKIKHKMHQDNLVNPVNKMAYSNALVSNLLPYQSFDEVNNIFYQINTKGFILEVSPLCGAQDETYLLLTQFLIHQLPPYAMMQVLLIASPNLSSYFEALTLSRNSDVQTFLIEKQCDYLSGSTWNSLYVDQSFLIRDFKLYILISMPQIIKEENLINLKAQLKNTLSTLGMINFDVGIYSFLSLLKFLLNAKESDKNLSWLKNTPLCEQLVEYDTSLKVEADFLQFEKVNRVCQTFSVQNYPKEWQGILMGECMGSLLKDTLQIPAPFYVHWIVKPLEVSSSRKKVLVKTLRSQQLANSLLSKWMPRAKKIAADWQHVLEAFDEGECLVHHFMQVVLLSEKENLTHASYSLKNLWQSLGFELTLDKYLQLPLWLSSLPFMCLELYYPDLKKLKRFKTILASNAVHLMPIQAEYKGGVSPCLPLVGRRGQLFFFDPFENTGGNYNTAIAGKSGSGKSVLMQALMNGILGLNGKVFVLDVGRSFEKACHLQQGEFITFDIKHPLSLNPFTHIDCLEESLVMLKPLIAAMATYERKTDDYENALIEKAILAVWQKQGRNSTISMIANYLLSKEDSRAQDLGTMLFAYTTHGMYGGFFEGPCAFDFNKKLIVLELEDLKSKKDLQQIVLMMLMFHVTEFMYKGDRKERIACMIDEAWDLLRGDLAGELMETGCRRARKYKGAFITGTQSVNDFYQTKASSVKDLPKWPQGIRDLAPPPRKKFYAIFLNNQSFYCYIFYHSSSMFVQV